MAKTIFAGLLLLVLLVAGASAMTTKTKEFPPEFSGEMRVLAVDKDLNVIDNANEAHEHYLRTKRLPNDLPALAILTNSLNTTGWWMLEVITNDQYNDTYQAYSAGYSEGVMTQHLINDASYNYVNGLFNGRAPSYEAQTFINDQLYWMRQNVRFYANESYWYTVGLHLSQLDGMYKGYLYQQGQVDNASQAITFEQFYSLTNWADQLDIQDAFVEDRGPRDPMCDLLIRVTPDNLFTAHTTFFKYYLMLRVWKVYDFSFNDSIVANKRISFSSRPGALSSADDYYTFGDYWTSETSLPNYNITNFRYLHSNSVPSWLRVMLANRISTNGSAWVDNFRQYRSGTYNNQWFFVDFSQYRKQQNTTAPWKNIVWMVEEFFYEYKPQDMSQTLQENGYIASYNMPINEKIFSVSGIKNSPLNGYTYNTVPRALLFEQLFTYGGYVEGMKWLLYLNQNLTGFPCALPPTYSLDAEIAPRCDLIHLTGGPVKLYGLIDAKFTNNDLIRAGGSWIRNGPTQSGFEYPFNWTVWPDHPHQGMPEVFNFSWTFVQDVSVQQGLHSQFAVELDM